MAVRLNRTAFTTDRALEFFSESELTTQLGYGRRLWPLVLIKELVDNALDATESTTVAPIITVTLEPDTLTVADNGSGLPAAIVERSLDYHVRISDKKHYVAPTRGQLGNALKCVWAAPLVAHGEGLIELIAAGLHHRVEVSLDRIAQKPRINHTTEPSSVKNGTSVKIHWSGVASLPMDDLQGFYHSSAAPAAYPLTKLIADYAAFNPHASFVLNLPEGEPLHFPASDPKWRKWRADWPTNPHWYTPAQFRGLIAAYIGESDRPARDFLAEFDGLSGTQVRATVLNQAFPSNSIRKLSDLVVNDDLDIATITTLLDTMKRNTKPVKPVRLGVLGRRHLERVLAAHGAANVEYRKVLEFDQQGLPCVVECAFGVKGGDIEPDDQPDDADRDGGDDDEDQAAVEVEDTPSPVNPLLQIRGRTMILGLNWAPVLKTPSATIAQTLAYECRVDQSDPVVFLLHQARPRFAFTDHGKGALADE